MKLDRLKFAKLVAFVQKCIVSQYDIEDEQIQQLDALTTNDTPSVAPTVFDLETLLVAHANGRKIETIKTVRTITGLGLKEAKELVERAPVNHSDAVQDYRRRMTSVIEKFSYNRDENGDLVKDFILKSFTNQELEKVRDFILSFVP